MLKTKVKASSITNLTDARYFAAWEVEWLGFNLDPLSENYIDPASMKAIKEWVDGVKIVGEFSSPSTQDIPEAVQLLDLDAVQFSPFSTVEEISNLAITVPIFLEVIIEPGQSEAAIRDLLEPYQGLVQYFLINLDKNGINWEAVKARRVLSADFLSELCETFPSIISIDVRKEDLTEFLEKVRPSGLNLKGGDEEKTGFKSFDQLDEIFESLEILV